MIDWNIKMKAIQSLLNTSKSKEFYSKLNEKMKLELQKNKQQSVNKSAKQNENLEKFANECLEIDNQIQNLKSQLKDKKSSLIITIKKTSENLKDSFLENLDEKSDNFLKNNSTEKYISGYFKKMLIGEIN